MSRDDGVNKCDAPGAFAAAKLAASGGGSGTPECAMKALSAAVSSVPPSASLARDASRRMLGSCASGAASASSAYAHTVMHIHCCIYTAAYTLLHIQ